LLPPGYRHQVPHLRNPPLPDRKEIDLEPHIMILLRINKYYFNPAVAPHLTGHEETIVLTGDAAEAFKRWLKRQDVVDWPAGRPGAGTLNLGDGRRRPPRLF
jgi:hypothetical protein